jgi:hypothetical protein
VFERDIAADTCVFELMVIGGLERVRKRGLRLRKTNLRGWSEEEERLGSGRNVTVGRLLTWPPGRTQVRYHIALFLCRCGCGLQHSAGRCALTYSEVVSTTELDPIL